MFRALKIVTLVFMLATFGALTTGCGTDHSKVRFVHASSDAPNDAPNVDVAVDGQTVATDLAFQNVSPGSGYLTVEAGNRRVEVRQTGATDDLINSNIAFGTDREYTVVASGFVTPPLGSANGVGVAATVLTDDNSAPTSGNVKLRVLHASPGDGNPANVDVYIVAPDTDITSLTPNISNLAYGQASSYQDVPATSNQVIFTAPGAKSSLINQTYALSAGQIRTLVTVNVQAGLTMSTTPVVLNDLN